MTIDVKDQRSDGPGSSAEGFLADPLTFFEMSFQQMHSISRERLQELQLAALASRFDQQVEQVAMLGKLANRQGISHIDSLEDVVPLLFEHTMYKSYPLALLERQQFAKLTGWLAKLTSVDLSGVDASACDSIDSWLDALAAQSELDVTHSGGTSGTISIFPWSKSDNEYRSRFLRVAALQSFDAPPTKEQLETPYHHVTQNARYRSDKNHDAFTLGLPGHVHEAIPRRSADLLWLASRIRLAQAKGDVSRVDVPASLLARRDELAQMQASEPGLVEAWVKEISNLQGEHIMMSVFPANLYEIAAPRVENGEHWTFAPGSTIVLVGGSKGKVLPDDWKSTVLRLSDAQVKDTYSMSEHGQLFVMCSAGRYHVTPLVIPYVLDPETSALLPRRGVQTGRFAFFDLLTESHWGGLMTGDEVEVDFDDLCSCGASSVHMGSQIGRLSEKRGGDDKITCTATPQAFEEAMQFLTTF
jgi:hypothetical protein